MLYSISNHRFEEIISDISVLFYSNLKKPNLKKDLDNLLIYSNNQNNSIALFIEKLKAFKKDNDFRSIINSDFIYPDLNFVKLNNLEYENELFFKFLIQKFPKLNLEQYLNHEHIFNFTNIKNEVDIKKLSANFDIISKKIGNEKDSLFVDITDEQVRSIIELSEYSKYFYDFLSELSPNLNNLNNPENEIVKEFKEWFINEKDIVDKKEINEKQEILVDLQNKHNSLMNEIQEMKSSLLRKKIELHINKKIEHSKRSKKEINKTNLFKFIVNFFKNL